jgi:DNA processing protein
VGGSRRVAAGERDFPTRLGGIASPPAGLWLASGLTRDELAQRLWTCPAVAIVGARAASAAGLELARRLAWDLARAGVLVVSGLARGIDGAAHEGALLAGGATVAVLGSGIDCCYPEEHAPLARRIAATGALLSEWPPGTPALPWRFPRRNRLISGLSDIVVLVEGEMRSGARHTVHFALDQGREVMAVPRDPLLPGSEAPNRLLQEGAVPALRASDVLAQLAARGVGPGQATVSPAVATAASADGAPERARPARRQRAADRASGPDAGGDDQRLLTRLSRAGGLTFDQLALDSPELSPATIQARLVTLEVEGRIRRDRRGCLHPVAGG